MSGKAWCDLVSAVFALSAATAWFIAASHPVATPGPGMWGTSDPNHPVNVGLRKQGARILRGVAWNRVAAGLTGCSALASFLSWAVSVRGEGTWPPARGTAFLRNRGGVYD